MRQFSFNVVFVAFLVLAGFVSTYYIYFVVLSDFSMKARLLNSFNNSLGIALGIVAPIYSFLLAIVLYRFLTLMDPIRLVLMRAFQLILVSYTIVSIWNLGLYSSVIAIIVSASYIQGFEASIHMCRKVSTRKQ